MAQKRTPLVKDYILQNTSETRADLTKILEGFRKNRKKSLPIIFGSHGKPEAVLAPAWLWEKMIDEIENLRLEIIVMDRLANSQPSEPMTFAQYKEHMRKFVESQSDSDDVDDND
ncbi:MAG: hypothetical protein ACKOWJ_05940 [Micrococcales bacterium]